MSYPSPSELPARADLSPAGPDDRPALCSAPTIGFVPIVKSSPVMWCDLSRIVEMVFYSHGARVDRAAASPFHRFEIHAEQAPQSICRVAGAFAAQSIIPASLAARTSCGGLWMAIEADMPIARAERLAERLRAMICVSTVLLIPAPPGEAMTPPVSTCADD